jgi:serine-type D-Ala-D-Ala carboxypeptidase/endopeptidase (penicillin-binding protein 4)
MPVRARGILFSIMAVVLVAGIAPRVQAALEPEARTALRHPAPSPEAGDRSPAAEGHDRPRWKRRIDRLVGGRSVGVGVHLDDSVLYERAAKRSRIPASNQKLVASMVLLETFEPTDRIATLAAAPAPVGGVVTGDIWILGRGDPTISGGGSYGKSLTFPATGVGKLAAAINAAGITRVTGSVMGGTGYFEHDWWAKGWKDYFPSLYIALPSALTFNGNVADGRHVADPERRAARALTKKLRAAGTVVEGSAGAGAPPAGLAEVARVESAPMETLLRYMNRTSSNFFAEVLGKRAGVARAGAPGTIAKGARSVEAYASAREVSLVAHDSSGLSYANRVSARGLTRLLDDAEEEPWGNVLRRTLPTGGQGTLEDRLHGARVRAKTGTLVGHSALSGYVWLERRGEWASFSIISNGMDKSRAAAIEDRIVRLLEERAR